MGMAINNPVIVTALYDIGRDKWEKFTQSYGGYIHWMERTLSLDSKLVIYTQEKFKEEIENYRKLYDENLENTIIVIQELEDLEGYKLYNDKLNNLMFSDVFINKAHFDVPEMNKPLYNVIMFNKVYWIKDCVDKRYFDNDLVIWADAGGLRNPVEMYKGKVWPNIQKISSIDKIIFFSHNDSFTINDNQWHSLSQVRNIQGTSFFVPSSCANELVLDFNNTVNECIDSEFIGSDEKVFDIMYLKDISKYHLIKCTWREYYDIFS